MKANIPPFIINGINLTKEEFTKVAKVNSKLKLEKFKSKEYIYKKFKFLMKNVFSFDCKFQELEVKDKITSKVSGIACRFQIKRPLVFCLIQDQEFIVIDEKRFDAFNKGPFKNIDI